jgi:hypothetical protein
MEVLGLEAGASVPEARAAFLRGVGAAGFVPSPRLREAFEVVGGGRPLAPGARLLAEVRSAEEDRLRKEVEGLAGSFFAIPVPERRARWEQLRAACTKSPPLGARLDALAPGLGVVFETAAARAPDVEELARLACDLFVLPPRLRALRRQDWLARVQTGPKETAARWRAAARELKRRHPAIAALAPELLAPGALKVRKGDRPKSRRKSKPKPTAVPDSTSSRRRKSWVYLYILAILGGNLARFLSTQNAAKTPPATISVPSKQGLSSVAQLALFAPPGSRVEQLIPLALARELEKLGARVDQAQAKAILDRVAAVRARVNDPQLARSLANQQLARELQVLGIAPESHRLDELYETYWEPAPRKEGAAATAISPAPALVPTPAPAPARPASTGAPPMDAP